MNLLFILALAGLMQATRSFSDGGASGSVGVTLGFGFVILVAFYAGELFRALRLPRLTGCIVAGALVGPGGLGLLTEGMVGSLKLVNGVAVALIALTAGAELDFRAMRPLLKTVGWLTLVAVCGTALALAATVVALSGTLPFLGAMTFGQLLVVSLVLGVVVVAQSPAVVVALRDELEAEGPMTRTVLGVVVLSDLLVIVLFALTSTFAKAAFGTQAGAMETLGHLSWEILGSMAAGLALGALLAAYLRWVRHGAGLFLVTVAFAAAELAQGLAFDPLIVALAAGLFVRNVTAHGEALEAEIRGSSLPVYVVFFGVAGATMHWSALRTVGVPVVALVLVRGLGLLYGAKVAAGLAGAPEVVRRYVGYGLLPQAGLALALSILFAKTFPEFGSDAAALTLSIVALNELVAPVLYRMAIVRSGEAGKGHAAEGPEPELRAEGAPLPPVTLP